MQTFDKYSADQFELSYVDNCVIRLQILDTEYGITFSNVHKKHQFAELFSIDKFAAEQVADIPNVLQDKNFKVMATTWNMGQENNKAFVE